jgi:hypothetical protein
VCKGMEPESAVYTYLDMVLPYYLHYDMYYSLTCNTYTHIPVVVTTIMVSLIYVS